MAAATWGVGSHVFVPGRFPVSAALTAIVRRMELERRWLGRTSYRDAWALQHELVDARARGAIDDVLLLLEHPRVLTLGRQSDASFVRASAEELERAGVEVIRVERGGEVTYHGPGQLVAYPIVRLADRDLAIRPFVRALEGALVDTAATYGVAAARRDGYPGAWCGTDEGMPRKLAALGLRVERGVTYHGIALNVTTDLRDFGLIDPCGMPGVSVTSIAREGSWPPDDATAPTRSVALAAERFGAAFEARLGAVAAVPVGAASR